jgi:hypothetical protein
MMPQSIDTLGTLLNVLFQQGNICPERLTSPWSDNEKGVTLGLGKSDHVLTSCTQNKFKEDHSMFSLQFQFSFVPGLKVLKSQNLRGHGSHLDSEDSAIAMGVA